MRPMHPREHAIVEGLCSQGYPIDARTPPRGGGLGRHVFGIGFKRNFGGVETRHGRTGVEESCEQRREGVGRKERGSSAAQVETLKGLGVNAPGRASGDDIELFQHSIHVLFGRDTLAYRYGEVAVGAAAPAEGDVDVEVAHGGKVSTPLTPTRTPSPAAASRPRASRAPSGPSARRSYPCRRWRPARRHAWVPCGANPTATAATRSGLAAPVAGMVRSRTPCARRLASRALRGCLPS